MKRYTCNLLYEFDANDVIDLTNLALDNLGFSPKYMDVFFDGMKRPLNDISFNSEQIITLLKPKFGTVTIKNQLYDEENRETNCWFRLKISLGLPIGNTYSLEWSNTNLEWLLENNKLSSFLDSRNLFFCYCFDQYDCLDQSNDRINSFVVNYPNREYKTIKNYMGDEVIDVSEHWGRFINNKGITLMAAPLMWFGDEFFRLISKKDLLKFPGATTIKYQEIETVFINLFDVYSDPANTDNREKQRLFWQTFNLEKINQDKE